VVGEYRRDIQLVDATAGLNAAFNTSLPPFIVCGYGNGGGRCVAAKPHSSEFVQGV